MNNKDRKINITDIKRKAKTILRVKFSSTVLVTGLLMIFTSRLMKLELIFPTDLEPTFLGRVDISFHGWFAITDISASTMWIVILLIIFLYLFIMVPLKFGATKYYYNSITDQEAKSDLLAGLQKNYVKVLIANILTSPFAIVGLVVPTYTIMILCGLSIMFPFHPTTFTLVLLVLVLFLIETMFCFLNIVIIDNPDLSLKETILKSLSLTKGRLFKLIILKLSFMLWHILSLASFGLANIYVYPYVQYTFIYAFLDAQAKTLNID